MNCREFVDFIMAYLDGELDPEVHKTFEHHVGLCPPCGDYLAEYKTSVKLGKVAFEPCDEGGEVAPEVPERLLKAILEARKKEG